MNQTEKSPPRIQVLSIEDDPAIRRLLRSSMESSAFRLRLASSAAQGIEAIAKRPPEIVLIDISLPDRNGLDLIKQIRQWSAIPIIALSAHSEQKVKIECLMAGANDYVTKPFSISELFARMRAVLRRKSTLAVSNPWPVFVAGSLKVDLMNRRTWIADQEVYLTHLEFKLLATLIKYAGRVVSHEQLLEEVWGEEYSKESQYLRVYIGYLRKKLEGVSSGQVIVNEPRVGYRLSDEIAAYTS